MKPVFWRQNITIKRLLLIIILLSIIYVRHLVWKQGCLQMRFLKMNKTYTLLILIILLFSINNITTAAPLDFEKLVEIGLENNDSIQDIQQDIAALERNIELIKAGQDWQITIDADYSRSEDYQDKEDGNDGTLGLEFTKDYSSGFSIGPTVSITSDDYSPEYTVELSQRIFPWTPLESDKELYSQEKELEKLKKELAESRVSQLTSWMEAYLNLIRLQAKELLYKEQLKLAEEDLKEVIKKRDIGEAGQIELLEAELAVKEAEYQFKNTSKEFEEGKKDFYQDLGLSNEEELLLDENEDYLLTLMTKVSNFEIDPGKNTELLQQAEGISYELLANSFEREVLEKELEWLKSESNTDINLTGEYNTADEEGFTVGVNLSYLLYDGGQRKIEIADKEAEIIDLLDEYKRLKRELALEFEKKQHQIELDQDKLSQNELTYEKRILEEEIAKLQLAEGLINQIAYEENSLNRKDQEIALAEARDNLFISKLNLLALFKDESYFRGN
ncbi:TolC family protein [Halocella sp. SP3-1]|nr:TolC family protein [Halocella sp. SP3-1]